jgi:hypothetical protein
MSIETDVWLVGEFICSERECSLNGMPQSKPWLWGVHNGVNGPILCASFRYRCTR